VLFSEPKIPQSRGGKTSARRIGGFSALQRAENSSMAEAAEEEEGGERVSVLFSEPKIPQYDALKLLTESGLRFSALQRAENSSIARRARVTLRRRCFSALQRAENSSINPPLVHPRRSVEFQCSSASRKFLNRQ